MWLCMGFTTTGGFAPTAGSSWANAPVVRTRPAIAVKTIAPIKLIGLKLFIFSTFRLEVSVGETKFAHGNPDG
jgi:hypothetical protein